MADVCGEEYGGSLSITWGGGGISATAYDSVDRF